MGFSPWGLAIAVAVLAPSLLLLLRPPRPPLPTVRVSPVLSALERGGQAACLVIPVIVLPAPLAWAWAVPMAVFLAAYLGLWIRYVRRRDAGTLYRPWGPVPVPMAVLPVAVFATAGAWLGVIWLVLAAGVLAAGHIPTSLAVARALRADA